MSISEVEEISLYTDGACSGNPGKGGWAFVLIDESNNNVIHESSGKSDYTTNNIMEMTAVIKGLDYVLTSYDISKIKLKVYTDSTYVKNGITLWIKNWKKNNWQTAQRKDVKNKELWISIDDFVKQYNERIEWLWVKAHNGNKFNEKADSLARNQCQ